MVVTCFSSYYEKFADGKVVCIDDEIPFEIPDNWSFSRLGSVCDYLHRGKSPKYGMEQVLPIIAQKCNQWDKIYTDRCQFSDISFISKYTEEQYLQKGDIIINSTGGGTVGRTGIVEDYIFEKHQKFVADSHVTVVRGSILLNPYYLYYYLISPYIQTGIEERCSGSTNQIELGTSTIYNYLIPVPPYKEQLRIIELMGVLLQKVEKYRREQEKLENLRKILPLHLKKSILQEAIQGKLVPQDPNDEPASVLLQRIKEERLRLVAEGKLKKKDVIDSTIFRGDDNRYYEKVGKTITDITDEIPFDIPDNWEWCRISTICNITNGFTPLRTEDKYWKNGDTNWFTVEDIRAQGEYINFTKQKITKEATTPERIVRAGSVLLCCTASVGQCAFTNIPTTTNQQFNALTIKEDYRHLMLDEYLFLFAKTLKDELHRLSGKTTFEFVSVRKVGNILVPIPPLSEQQRIVNKIEKVFNEIKG